MDFPVGARDKIFQKAAGFGFGREGGELGQVGGGAFVKLMKPLHADRAASGFGSASNRSSISSSSAQTGRSLAMNFCKSISQQLPLFDAHVLRDEFGASASLSSRENRTPRRCKTFCSSRSFCHCRCPPKLLIKIVRCRHVRAGEQRLHARRTYHVHQHQMLPPDQFHIAHETLRECRDRPARSEKPAARAGAAASRMNVQSSSKSGVTIFGCNV